MGWLKNEIYDPWMRGAKDIDVIQFASILNPAFPISEFERMQGKMQDWRFQMFYMGQYSTPPSMIYGCVEADHWIEPFEIPFHWPVICGVDPSGGHCGTLWLAQNPQSGDWVAFRETFDHDKTTSENVTAAKELQTAGHQTEFVGGGPSETQERRDWSDNGIQLQKPSVMGVDAGIDRAVSLFKRMQLFLFNDLRMLRDEIGSYRRKTDENGNPTADIMDKRRYHILDCLRAAAVQIEQQPDGAMPNFLSTYRGT